MIFALGYISGLATSILILVGAIHFRPAIDRTMNRVSSVVKQKGSILEPDDGDVKDWVDKLPEK